MTYAPGPPKITLSTSALMLPGHAIWKLRGQPVWAGRLGQPVEDLTYDEMILHPDDLRRWEQEAATQNPPD